MQSLNKGTGSLMGESSYAPDTLLATRLTLASRGEKPGSWSVLDRSTWNLLSGPMWLTK